MNTLKNTFEYASDQARKDDPASIVADCASRKRRNPLAVAVPVTLALSVALLSGCSAVDQVTGALDASAVNAIEAAAQAATEAAASESDSAHEANDVDAASSSSSSSTARAESSSSASSAQSSSSSAKSHTKAAGSVKVKQEVDDYTWSELSDIADAISQAEDEDEAIEIAIEYNLCKPDGTLDGTQVKYIDLVDSDIVDSAAQIVGFYHDDKADGSGKAGITFMFKDVIGTCPMNAKGTNDGGWKGSDVRAWLSKEGMALLPKDLSINIVSVTKETNNTGVTSKVSAVTETSDKLWAVSFTELLGEIDIIDGNEIYNKEGEQYQLFEDAGIKFVNSADNNKDVALLQKVLKTEEVLDQPEVIETEQGKFTIESKQSETEHSWWQRSSVVDDDQYYLSVSYSGATNNIITAEHPSGVAPGFCL